MAIEEDKYGNIVDQAGVKDVNKQHEDQLPWEGLVVAYHPTRQAADVHRPGYGTLTDIPIYGAGLDATGTYNSPLLYTHLAQQKDKDAPGPGGKYQTDPHYFYANDESETKSDYSKAMRDYNPAYFPAGDLKLAQKDGARTAAKARTEGDLPYRLRNRAVAIVIKTVNYWAIVGFRYLAAYPYGKYNDNTEQFSDAKDDTFNSSPLAPYLKEGRKISRHDDGSFSMHDDNGEFFAFHTSGFNVYMGQDTRKQDKLFQDHLEIGQSFYQEPEMHGHEFLSENKPILIENTYGHAEKYHRDRTEATELLRPRWSKLGGAGATKDDKKNYAHVHAKNYEGYLWENETNKEEVGYKSKLITVIQHPGGSELVWDAAGLDFVNGAHQYFRIQTKTHVKDAQKEKVVPMQHSIDLTNRATDRLGLRFSSIAKSSPSEQSLFMDMKYDKANFPDRDKETFTNRWRTERSQYIEQSRETKEPDHTPPSYNERPHRKGHTHIINDYGDSLQDHLDAKNDVNNINLKQQLAMDYEIKTKKVQSATTQLSTDEHHYLKTDYENTTGKRAWTTKIQHGDPTMKTIETDDKQGNAFFMITSVKK